MAANESAQQLVVQTPWRSDNLVELKLGRDIEIVADVAGLEIEIDERDLGVLRRFVPDEMDGGFDRQRRIADSARAGNKRDNHRRFDRVSVPRRRADAPNNLENFLRESGLGDPVGVAGL